MDRITASLSHLERELTAHAQGTKQVFLRPGDSLSGLTQFAYGVFMRTDHCERHVHPTMEECFFFLKGDGRFEIGEQHIPLGKGVFVRVPAGAAHRLVATGEEPLEYIYFGIAIG
ncbi:cupin domain-containing protein [Larkinella soli]|uniref:cupin domain-containing protein n=1 Tax=Larkinella soli TaxID=1770527 RepID=UPI000FFB15A1|nr:cupin domain-containing protein [Larkinella soli]